MTAIASPLLESSIQGAKGVVFNITGGHDLTLHEVNIAAEIIYDVVDPNANIIFGAVIDERLQGEIRITVIATGFTGDEEVPEPKAKTVTPPAPSPDPEPPLIDDPPELELEPYVEETPPLSPFPDEPPSTQPNVPNLDIPDFLKNRRPRQ